ncbi:MAG: hypothetical protein KDD40_02230, partial [Bdellovibrionales bacterium]|nr:hypothetical protein [Bdellovibrionales bacterium]
SVNINESCVASSESNKDVHCFIATAAYGSYLNSQVVKLKSFRDNVLKKTLLGRKFVDFYYTYSPRLAFYISQKPNLRKITRWVLTPFIFFIAYPSSGLLALVSFFLFLLAFRKKNKLLIIPIFFFLFFNKVRAQVAQPSLFDQNITINPAALQAPFRTNYLGYTQSVVSGEGKSSNYKQEYSGSGGVLNAAVMWETGGLVVQNQLKTNVDIDTTVGSSKVKNITSSEHIKVNLAVAIFEQTHLGINYGQFKYTDDNNVSSTLIERENSNFGLGVKSRFGEFFYVGASAEHVTEKGSEIPDTKWIQSALGFGLSQRAEGDAWVLEIFATRTPEILNQEESKVTRYGEKFATGIVAEREMPLADTLFNTMSIGAKYVAETSKELDPYLEEQKTTNMGINWGIKTFNKSLNAIASYEIFKEDFGAKREFNKISLTLMYNFSGSIFSLAGVTQ